MGSRILRDSASTELTPTYDALMAERAERLVQALHEAHPEYDEVTLLEPDETIPPRPEEEVADAVRDPA